ncbi:hypothetical protein FB567DRAFT_514985 [Paraphoma chrysanthemicola]|uniref:NACHT domain-containing protein n=1 Tax=Paraphoma chrysanthemicola TaxID=798071 RepID=A0A8K0W409_9PLEO|nr:hypothetical protein FB567DRAFT_514985 [Paraphoma chrysanthemicola]
MEPLVALGVASNIIQIADFSGRMISRSKEIYTSANGTLSVYTDLEDAARNLQELSRELEANAEIASKSSKAGREGQKATLQAAKFAETAHSRFLARSAQYASLASERDEQGDALKGLKKEAKAKKDAENEKGRLAAIEKQKKRRAAEKQLVDLSQETKRLTDSMINSIQKFKSEGSKSKVQSIHQAFRSIWSESQLKAMEKSLDNIRKQTDTALLFSVREQLDDLRQNPASGVEGQIFKFIEEFDMKHHELLEVLSSSARSNNLEVRNAELRKTVDSDSVVPMGSMDGLADRVDSLVQSQLLSRFKLIIEARLIFVDMRDRFERISKSHEDTFAWIYKRPEDHPEHGRWNDFAQWLGASDTARLYWITGKPGSGKSTLMKYLYDNPETMECLRPWAAGSRVFRAGYFFWNSGTAMQMSREGLLKTLLIELTRQILASETDPHVLEKIFSDRWSQFVAFGGGRSPFTWSELRRSFQALISDTSKLFFLVIDGLDEFDGDPSEIIKFVLGLAKCPNIKICTASRPWPIFEDAFHKRPSLLLEDLTRKDIRNYVTSKFEENRHYTRLVQYKEKEATALVAEIINKASGVFLWVYLVVDALLQGISNADTMSELQVTLDTLPADLEDLFDKLLDKFEPKYYRQACEIIRLVGTHISPSLLDLSYAVDDDIHSGMSTNFQPSTSGEIADRVEHMNRRLKSRCKGFLEVYVRSEVQSETGTSYAERMHVGFLHRTARDYFRSERIGIKILDATSHPPFDPCERWANACLWSLKRKIAGEKLSTSPGNWPAWEPLAWCMEYALRLQLQDDHVRLTYLDEIGRVSNLPIQQRWDVGRRSGPHGYRSFLGIARHLRMDEYLTIKLQNTSIEEVKQLGLVITSFRGTEDDRETWLYGRTALLARCKRSGEVSCDVVEMLKYRSMSNLRRKFSSKPSVKLLPYI